MHPSVQCGDPDSADWSQGVHGFYGVAAGAWACTTPDTGGPALVAEPASFTVMGPALAAICSGSSGMVSMRSAERRCSLWLSAEAPVRRSLQIESPTSLVPQVPGPQAGVDPTSETFTWDDMQKAPVEEWRTSPSRGLATRDSWCGSMPWSCPAGTFLRVRRRDGTRCGQLLLDHFFDRPAGVALGTRRARAAILQMVALPGCSHIYRGEELGVPEV